MNVAEYVIALLPARVGVSEGTAFVVFKLYGLDASTGLVLYTFLRVRNILIHALLTPFAFLNRNRNGGMADEPNTTAAPAPGAAEARDSVAPTFPPVSPL
jgi:hypothetical protein